MIHYTTWPLMALVSIFLVFILLPAFPLKLMMAFVLGFGAAAFTLPALFSRLEWDAERIVMYDFLNRIKENIVWDDVLELELRVDGKGKWRSIRHKTGLMLVSHFTNFDLFVKDARSRGGIKISEHH